jgi:hypothetical protein
MSIRKLAAESLGTALLVFAAVGAWRRCAKAAVAVHRRSLLGGALAAVCTGFLLASRPAALGR